MGLLISITELSAQSFGTYWNLGHLGLSGEIRPVHDGEQRLREAASHGFDQALVPAANAPRKPINGLSVMPVRSIAEALAHASE